MVMVDACTLQSLQWIPGLFLRVHISVLLRDVYENLGWGTGFYHSVHEAPAITIKASAR